MSNENKNPHCHKINSIVESDLFSREVQSWQLRAYGFAVRGDEDTSEDQVCEASTAGLAQEIAERWNAYQNVESVNLKSAPGALKHGAWYPVIDKCNNQECAMWDADSEMFIDVDCHSVCSIKNAEWIGPEIKFKAGEKE